MPTKFFIFLSISTIIGIDSLNAQDADKGPIPSDFTCDGILIVVKPENKNTIPGYEKHVKKEFENYKGKYVIATKKEIETNSLYQDKKIYRFILQLEWRQVMGGTDPKMRMWFFLEDRERGKIYNGIGEKRTGKETLEHTVKMLNGNCK